MFRGPVAVAVCVFALALALSAVAGAQARDRYSLVHGCWTLAPAGASAPLTEPLRFQATALGRYLLYGEGGTFLSDVDGAAGAPALPSPRGDWIVRPAGDGAFTFTLDSGRALTVRGGRLRTGSDPAPLVPSPATGCAVYPEVEVNASGRPSTTPRFGETRGLLDAHMHMMAFEFLGGLAHCGRPWHRYGAPYALVDCPDHYPNGQGAVLENALSFGDPFHRHDPVGWPTFRDWPNHSSLTHEQSYYKWLERSWRGGLRVFVNLFAENKVLCELYPFHRNSCDEMDAVRLQARDIRALQDYIDAQSGGPGKGWFRIVTDPFQARRVINEGKLAVVLGIEISEPFGCQLLNDVPQCSADDIDRELDEVYDLGVRDMELINKFDNALGGVAGDSGATGILVNTGNKITTGRFWDMKPCTGAPDERDRAESTVAPHNHDDMISQGLAALAPALGLPAYAPGPLCNTKGLSALGEHLVRRMMAKQMMVDPDHLSVLARDQALKLLEASQYRGVVSSHSWSTPGTYPRVYALGGVVTPYAGDSTGFVNAWRTIRAERSFKYYFGFGYGADMNGFGSQGGPRLNALNPVRYPLKSFDGRVTLDRQRSGGRVFDINTDGVAHYGLYPDWVEDLRMQAGDAIVQDMARGAEAYLQMWERTVGVPERRRVARRAGLTPRGLTPAGLRLGRGRAAVIASTAAGHCAGGLRRGDRLAGDGVVRRGPFAYAVRDGRVRAVAAVRAGVRPALVRESVTLRAR